MRVKIREVLDDCIAQGIDTGYRRAHKYEDNPDDIHIRGCIEDEVWLEIDRHFDFEQCASRSVCDEVVEGFDQLEREREWVGLGDEYGVGRFYTRDFLDGAKWAEEKLKELNT